MLKIGLTGGIGSGKTTVAQIFEVLGIPVYYSDDEAKKLMNKDENLKLQIIHHFGTASYNDGILNRSFLSEAVFSDQEKTALINSIIHPATIADAENWMNKQTAPYAIKEAALIFEADADKMLDLVVGVYAREELRIKRVMDRNNISLEAVKLRMKSQMDDEVKMSLCDAVILNDEQSLLIPQVVDFHQKLLQNIERLHG
ncbi:MAG: dephospho-CoA kinase [Ferruginibacter sp.]